MFPTFISILDIQSWWEVPSIAHFCSLFRTAFNLLDFDIEALEEALLNDGTEDSSWLQELIVRLLSGCLPNNEISTFNYQMFLRRLFRQKCQEHDRYNPFNTDVDFQLLPLRTKVDILQTLCDFRLDADDVLDQLKNLEADSLRVEPLGFDFNDSAYWYFYGTRLYREDFKTRNNKERSVWQVICFTEEDWFQLNKKFKNSDSKGEKQLHRTLTENFLPELPRLFREKETLARRRLLESIPAPIRTSERLKKEHLLTTEKEIVPQEIKREAHVRRNRSKENSKDSESEKSEERYEMAGNKARQKKSKGRQRKLSTSSNNSKDGTPAPRGTKRKKTGDESKSSVSAATTVGRQTNNSLSAATGKIVIQQVAHPQKKKLKVSQVFRQTDEDLIIGMHKILDYVKNHEDAWPFADPVEEDYAPNYYTVIRKPMDLQRMDDRLDSGYYKNFTKFRDDFQLIVDNCRLYNGVENEYTEMVDNLLKVFETATDKFLDQISSSDDEIAVEFPKGKGNPKETKKPNSEPTPKPNSKRKPMLAAKPDKKRDRSLSEESSSKLSSASDLDNDKDEISSPKKGKPSKKSEKLQPKKKAKEKNDKKNVKNEKEKTVSKTVKHKNKKEKYNSKTRSRSKSLTQDSMKRRYSSSPPPSSAPSSPDSRFDFSPKKHLRTSSDCKKSDKEPPSKAKHKAQQDKFKELFEEDDKVSPSTAPFKKLTEKSQTSIIKPKDKHNKLRETIEKLKAKSEISTKINDDDLSLDLDALKENEMLKDNGDKFKKKIKTTKTHTKNDHIFEDSNSTLESHQSDIKNKKPNAKSGDMKNAAIEALTLATEQTLKDINKWLDDTPKFSEFSSASNSPSYGVLDEFDLGSKLDDPRKKSEKFNVNVKKDPFGKDIKRRTFTRDPAKFLKRREVQRTIDRLQPGKGKGNLITNVQSAKQQDEIFPLGSLSKNIKDAKNSLIVKADENAPKLSLGTVLDSFGRHKFVDDSSKKVDNETSDVKEKTEEKGVVQVENSSETDLKQTTVDVEPKIEEKKKVPTNEVPNMMSDATPNLSAWFKAFGAPKVSSVPKKTDAKPEAKEDKVEEKHVAEELPRKVPIPEPSPTIDSPNAVPLNGQPALRPRRVSTGSSVSERSSFSQDMDSPRVGIDERLGSYPAPYPSPMHRSPSGASPVMASPRPDASPKAAPYPPFNGQIKVGFYQDTVSNKSSPDKSCSPRDNPQSPYAQCSEHVYTPNTTQNTYSYPNLPYFTTAPNYSNANPTLPYQAEGITTSSYYDTSKSLTDQYQAKTTQNYGTCSPVNSPVTHSQHSPNVQDTFRQEDQNQSKMNEKPSQNSIFPVKKRVYTDADSRYEMELTRNMQQMNPNQLTLQPPRPEEPIKQYIQNIPDPKPITVQAEPPTINPGQSGPHLPPAPSVNFSVPPQNYPNHYNETNYPLNIPSGRSIASNTKVDLSKYTNMGYTGPEANFSRTMQHFNRPDLAAYGRATNSQQPVLSNQQIQHPPLDARYTNTNMPPYKAMEINSAVSNPQQAHANYSNTQSHASATRLMPMDQGGVSIPRPTYNSHLDMEQPLGLRGNIASLSHIVERYNNDERMLSGLQQSASQYYSEKGLTPGHMFNKPMSTSASIFNQSNMGMQSYNQNLQTTTTMYNRQVSEVPNPTVINDGKGASVPSPVVEKKTKKRKSSKTAQVTAATTEAPPTANNQGFQSYVGLKANSSQEPSAISLKTASVVPGSAFNFGPTPAGLNIGSGLYGDKDAYPNFLDEFRAAPNYYIAAATAAHHRSTPDTPDKQTRVAHQSSAPQAPSYPFIGAPQPRPPSYPLGSPFIPSAQAQLMDASSPLYQHYLQAGVLNQGLLAPPGAYPPGYHPALSMRQPYDSMTRPPWL